MTDDAIRANLSYVLHAPSRSRQVETVARDLARARRELDAAARRLARLPTDVLAARTLVLAPSGEPRAGSPATALTVQVGPWRLLGRLLTARYGRDNDARWEARIVDDPGCVDAAPVEFFRGPARLCLPVHAHPPACWFATLVLRPGGSSLLLELTPLTDPDPDARALRVAEAAIRTHVGQWTCSAPLWPRPAEEQLSEFLTG